MVSFEEHNVLRFTGRYITKGLEGMFERRSILGSNSTWNLQLWRSEIKLNDMCLEFPLKRINQLVVLSTLCVIQKVCGLHNCVFRARTHTHFWCEVTQWNSRVTEIFIISCIIKWLVTFLNWIKCHLYENTCSTPSTCTKAFFKSLATLSLLT